MKLILLGLFLLAYLAGSIQSRCETKRNQKFPGTKLLELLAPNPEFCCLECSNYPACVAWNFDSSGQCELLSDLKGDSTSAENSKYYLRKIIDLL